MMPHWFLGHNMLLKTNTHLETAQDCRITTNGARNVFKLKNESWESVVFSFTQTTNVRLTDPMLLVVQVGVL